MQHKPPTQSHIRAAMRIWSDTGGRTKFRVQGHCMSPIIRNGNTVHLVHGCKNMHVGDVVMYGEPDDYKLHRIIHLDKRRRIFLLKGDNADSVDPPMQPSGILAKVVAVEDEHGVMDFEKWRWRLTNRVIARFSYYEAVVRARNSIVSRAMYALGSAMGRRVRSLIRPNSLAWRLRTARRWKA
jgi:hypothetical protein